MRDGPLRARLRRLRENGVVEVGFVGAVLSALVVQVIVTLLR